jgi:spermidine synthase
VKTTAEAVRAPALPPGLRRYLYLTAAVTGGAIMIVEILGAKLLAPYVGTSHFVWTAQIAVTLIALATGYALGGWLVDRSPRLTWIYGAILAAALYLCGAVLASEPAAFACLRFRLAIGSLLAAALLFFVPLSLLAMVCPFFVRVLTVSVANVGSNVGRLSSVSTAGSVAGTVLIGYIVIPYLPNTLTMFLTAGLLMAVSLVYFLVWERRHAAPALTAALFGAIVGSLGALRPVLHDVEQSTELFRGNSNFGMLQVIQSKDGARRYYLNDLLTQNTYDPASHQSISLFTYMLHDLALAYTPEVKDVLCVGVGVGIVPSRFAREGMRVDAVEINPAVVPLAARFFDFKPEQLNLTIGDGRQFLNQGDRRYDAIVVDAFLGESPPSHLMTREAFRAMQKRLRAHGALVMNTFGDFTAGKDFFCASIEKTLKSVFKSVRIHAAGNGNVFFVASDEPDLRLLREPDYDVMPGMVRGLARAAIDGLMQTNPEHGIVLTDNYNPVDFYDAPNREDLRVRLAASYRPD